MPELLYYEDPHLLEFEATVAAIIEHDGRVGVTLDRTAFYPEGGGQPCDRGEIAGVPVVEVRKIDGEVVHLIGTDAGPLEPGSRVRAAVDAGRRRDYQQQHTGQHILSAALMQVGPYPTVSVHQGEDYTTIEIDAPELPAGDLEQVERLANAAIEADYAVTAEWATDETIDRFPLRRPPKVSGSIRVVQVGDLDCVACGGVHVGRTGEIRLVRALAVETIRGRVRTAWKIGDRALKHYRESSAIVGRLGTALSAQPHEIVDRVARQEEKIREVELRARRLADRVHELVASQLAAGAAEDGRGTEDGGATEDGGVVAAAFSGEEPDFLRGVTERLVLRDRIVVCVVNRSDDRLQWSIGVGSGSELDFNRVRAELLPLIGGKGGGRPPIWQGVGTREEGIDEFLERFRSLRSG